MNQFKTNCPNCDSSLNVPNSYLGQNIKCGGCQRDFVANPIQEAPTFTPIPQSEVQIRTKASEFKIVQTALLCFLFGGLGVHAFFTKNRNQGAILLGLTILGILLYFGSVSIGSTSSFKGFGAIAILASYVFALGDLLRLLMGRYKDGEKKTLTEWS